jgi:F-type H+-transporting ATPase subunit epsilon
MFTLSILTPEKRLVTEQEIDEVIVPGYRGQLDFLPGHAPLVTTLQAGVLRYRLKGEVQHKSVAVSWGYAEVNPNGVVVLAETAETPEEIDRHRAEEALKKSADYLARMTVSPEEITKYQRKIERAQARLDLIHEEKLSH